MTSQESRHKKNSWALIENLKIRRHRLTIGRSNYSIWVQLMSIRTTHPKPIKNLNGMKKTLIKNQRNRKKEI